MCRSEIADTLDLTQADIETLQDMLANSQVHLNFDAIKEVRCSRVLFKILSQLDTSLLKVKVNTKFVVVFVVYSCACPNYPCLCHQNWYISVTIFFLSVNVSD